MATHQEEASEEEQEAEGEPCHTDERRTVRLKTAMELTTDHTTSDQEGANVVAIEVVEEEETTIQRHTISPEEATEAEELKEETKADHRDNQSGKHPFPMTAIASPTRRSNSWTKWFNNTVKALKALST